MSQSESKKIDFQALLETVSNLDPQNIGAWPAFVKYGIAALVFIVVLVGGYWFLIIDRNDEFDRLASQETDLMRQYEQRSFEALNLEQYKRQMADMEEMFGALLNQLPRDTEVPGLLEDITHTGVSSGLEIGKVDLGSVVEKEFFAELPIQILLRGDYHSFGSFVSGVAALSRIVTIGDFSIKPVQGGGRGAAASAPAGLLEMEVSAKTYRYAAPRQQTTNQRTNQKRGR